MVDQEQHCEELTLNANRRSRNRKLKLLVEDLGAQVRKSITLNKTTRNDRPLLKSIHILLCCLSGACIANNIALAGRGHDHRSLRLPFCRAESKRRTLVSQAILIDGLLVLHRVGDWLLGGRHYCCEVLELYVAVAEEDAVATLFLTAMPSISVPPTAKAIGLVVISTPMHPPAPMSADTCPVQTRIEVQRNDVYRRESETPSVDRPARLT